MANQREANPLMFVHNRAANGACDEYKTTQGALHGRQKAVIKARREAKRGIAERDSRSHKQREEESVTLACADERRVETIGVARDSRDTLAHPRAEMKRNCTNLKAIESKQLIFRHGRSQVRKTGSVQQKRQRP